MLRSPRRRTSLVDVMHRHRTRLRGVKATPHPKPGDPNYTVINYLYAGRIGHIHEVLEIGDRPLAKVGFDDRKIVYYFLDDLELDKRAKRGTFHDADLDRQKPT
jgi:hypothetical protein